MGEMKVLLRVIETLRPDLPNVVGAEKLTFDLLWLKISRILSPKSRAQGVRTSDANGMQFDSECLANSGLTSGAPLTSAYR